MNRSGFNSSQTSSSSSSAVNECVKYILCREGSKIPIKLADIRTHLEKFGTPAADMKHILTQADNVLKKVYGYKLVRTDAKDAKYIVILNNESNTVLSTYINPEHRLLLVAALTHIYMTGSPVKEEEMWTFLANAQLMKEGDDEKRKILTKTFTRQTYLKHNKNANGGNEFEWGQRAELEIPKIFILKKMAEAFNVEPSFWSELYRKTGHVEQEE